MLQLLEVYSPLNMEPTGKIATFGFTFPPKQMQNVSSKIAYFTFKNALQNWLSRLTDTTNQNKNNMVVNGTNICKQECRENIWQCMT